MPQPTVALAVFQACGEQADGPHALTGQFGHHAIDRIGVGSRKNGAVEYDQHDRRAIGCEIERGGFDHTATGNVKALPGQSGAGDGRHSRQARGESQLCQRRTCRVRAAMVAQRLQPAQRRGRQVRGDVEPWVGTTVARNDRERNILRRRQRADLLDTVAPIVDPAEQPDQDAARAGQSVLHIEIDGERMDEAAQIGQSQARQVFAPGAPGGCERAEVAVCKGQHDEIGRGLAEVFRGRRFLKSMPFPQQDMHALSRQQSGHRGVVETALADHDNPRQPFLVGTPGAIELRAHAGADALHQ